MIVGSAFETTVEDRNATNIASNIPESASRICRWDIWPCCSTGATSGRTATGTSSRRTSSMGWTVVVTVLLRGSLAGGVRGHVGVGTVSGRGAAGGLEVGDEAVEQVAEDAGLGLVPVGQGAEGPLGTEGARRGERGGSGVREAEQAGAPVLRVGPALDVAEPLQDGELPAGHRDVDADLRGERTAALVAVPLQRDEHRPAVGRQFAVELGGGAGAHVPARCGRAGRRWTVSRSRVSGVMGMGILAAANTCRPQPYR